MMYPENELRTRLNNQAEQLVTQRERVAALERVAWHLAKRVHHWRLATFAPAPLHAEALLQVESSERNSLDDITDDKAREIWTYALSYDTFNNSGNGPGDGPPDELSPFGKIPS